jgi:outer membrane receptor protein involved in Fe transport
MNKRVIIITMCMVASICGHASSFIVCQNPKEKTSSLTVSVYDKRDSTSLPSALIAVLPYKIWGTTGNDGVCTIQKIPYNESDKYSLSITLLGYEEVNYPIVLKEGNNNVVNIYLEEESLSIEGVVVVAQKNKSGESTSSKIGRQAIDHLQATSLKDLTQLLPGQILRSDPNLTNSGYLQLRTLQSNNSNNSFGASIMVDGIPVSSNASMDAGSNKLNQGAGVDLRSIGTENIESVEIIRGVASAEYGDVATGAMIINSKVGVSKLKVNAKIIPGILQANVEKGFKIGKNGCINISGDYANGKSDPRYKTDTYSRYIGSVIHTGNIFNGVWSITDKVTFKAIREWSGADPDEPASLQKYFDARNEYSLSLSHSGKINTNRLFSRTIKYDIAYNYAYNHLENEQLITAINSAYINTNTEGQYTATGLPSIYSTIWGDKSVPYNFYFKLSNSFNINTKRMKNYFNMGVVYSSDGNNGSGYYDHSEQFPAKSPARTRAYRDIPSLIQASAYIEDNITLYPGKDEYPNIKAQVGLRADMIQPGKAEEMISLSPRINTTLHINDRFSIRGAYGVSEKAPSLSILYPEKSYYDFYNINVTDGGSSYYLYTTNIFETTNRDLKPMRNTKYEVGLDLNILDMDFSIVAYYEAIKNGFSYDRNRWVSLCYDRWNASSVSIKDGKITYDKGNPSYRDTVLYNDVKSGNNQIHISQGVEYDFNLGKINATNTSFYINGAYAQTEYSTSNNYYKLPTGTSKTYGDVYVVYKDGTGTYTKLRNFSSALRIVQHIPKIGFIVSATIQADLYSYSRSIEISDMPVGYITTDPNSQWSGNRGGVKYIPFTQAELDDPSYQFKGYMLKDQKYSLTNNKAEVWPSIWSINLRVSKDINKSLGFSFFVNNFLYYQPWQSSSISSNPVEKNSSLFSYGFEMYLNLK